MKYLFFIVGFALSLTSFSQEESIEYDTLTLTGTYSGKNIFVKNQFSQTEGFTVQSVIVNKKITNGEYNQSAFEIKLSEMVSAEGESLEITIVYLKGKVPVILNKELLD